MAQIILQKHKKLTCKFLEVSMNLKKSQKGGLLDLEPIYILEKVDFSSTTEVLLRMM